MISVGQGEIPVYYQGRDASISYNIISCDLLG